MYNKIVMRVHIIIFSSQKEQKPQDRGSGGFCMLPATVIIQSWAFCAIEKRRLI